MLRELRFVILPLVILVDKLDKVKRASLSPPD